MSEKSFVFMLSMCFGWWSEKLTHNAQIYEGFSNDCFFYLAVIQFNQIDLPLRYTKCETL